MKTDTARFLLLLQGGGSIPGTTTSPGVMAVASADISPTLHLTALAGGGTRVVDVIGDSTTVTGTLNNAVDDSQQINTALKLAFKRANPGLNLIWNNRAIGGTLWNHPAMTGNALQASLGVSNIQQNYPWFTNLANTWLSYVIADAPDVLIVNFGTNGPLAGSNTLMMDFLGTISAMAKVPNVIMLTPRVNYNPASPSNMNAYHACIAMIRTLCRSNGAGAKPVKFPNIPYLGLIDLGRNYIAATEGFDQAIQYMEAVPNSAQSNVLLVNNTPIPIGTTAHGDFAYQLVFPNGGNNNLRNWGLAKLFCYCGDSSANYIVFTFAASGVWNTQYQSTGAAYDLVNGTNFAPPAGDVTVVVSCRGERITVDINGFRALEISQARYYDNFAVTVSPQGALGTNTFMNVSWFYQGIGTPLSPRITPPDYFGSVGGPWGGSGLNHPSSKGDAIDWGVVDQLNFAAPPVPQIIPTVDPHVIGQVWANAGVLNTSPGNPAAWAFAGSAIDIDFVNSRAAVGGQTIPLSAMLTATRTSGAYADYVSGAWAAFGANVPRYTDKGLLCERAGTNNALWCRDFTQSAWTKTNMTAALNATGIDGTASAACTLTATGANATVMQALPVASALYTFSVFLKRVTGSGTIQITNDGGSTYATVTVTDTVNYVRVSRNQTLVPTIGIKISTSGDAIIADFAQCEGVNGYVSSPIYTTTAIATRAPDVVTVNNPPALTSGTYTLFASGSPEAPTNAANVQCLLTISDGTNANRFMLRRLQGTGVVQEVWTVSGSELAVSGAAWAQNTAGKAAAAAAAADQAISFNGAAVVTGAQAGAPGGMNVINVGSDSSSVNQPDFYLTRVAVWLTRQSNANLQTFST